MKLVIVFLAIGLVKMQDSNDFRSSSDDSRSSAEETDQNRLASPRRTNGRGQWMNRRDNGFRAWNNRQARNFGHGGFQSQTEARTIRRPRPGLRNNPMRGNNPRNSRPFVDSSLRRRQPSRPSPVNARSRFGSNRRVTPGGPLFRRIVTRQLSPPFRLVYRYVSV
ncbi:uncharacterized protein LOC134714222 [Mytilus trossulus]|uniref:uncharacterized protein LOC134714222 n=1 Tax=Mytilus trossulus TaxID=6551 RepID=UPI003004723E